MTNFRGFVIPERYAICVAYPLHDGNGEGGIRTLGSLLSYGALAKRCFQPLSHLTNAEREYREQLPIANSDVRGVPAIFIGVANS